MRKIFTLAFFCLCYIAIHSQTQTSEIPDGHYVFEKAELFIRNYETKSIVEHKIITDTALIKPNTPHLENIFLKLEIENGVKRSCVLGDRQKYVWNELDQIEPDIDKKMVSENEIDDNNKYLFKDTGIAPFELKFENNILIIHFFKYPFGQTGVDFTMEAELTVIMTKQEER